MSSLDEFIQLVNTANGTSFVADDLVVDAPILFLENAQGDNTKVTIHGILTRGYVGEYTFEYRRRDIGRLFAGYTIKVVVPANQKTTAKVVENINLQFGLNIPLEDVQAGSVIDGQNTIIMNSNSYGWIGALSVVVNFESLSLDDQIRLTELDGFFYPYVS